MPRKPKQLEKPLKIRPPAKTPEARENQLSAMAMALAERQLADGTASSQIIYHFLKESSGKTKLEKEILELQKELTKAKTEKIQREKDVNEMYAKAIDAMRLYNGEAKEEPEDEEEELSRSRSSRRVRRTVRVPEAE